MASWLAEGTHRLLEWETDLSSQTGASQAGILLGKNDDIPAFRWVDKPTGKVIACSGPDDCKAIERVLLDRHRAARERRGEPRKPALRRRGRGDPHRQPRLRREEGEPRLPRVLRERVQRHALARPLLLGGRARAQRVAPLGPAERAAARASRRDVPLPARGRLRRRPGPDHLQRPRGHDVRAARGVRDPLELRRGRPPLRARAARHARGPAQARPADRPGLRSPPLRTPPVSRDRAVRPRPDAGGDVQAAQRLHARGSRRPLARRRPHDRDRRRRRAGRDREDRRAGGNRDRAAPREEMGRRTSPTATPSSSARATSASCT